MTDSGKNTADPVTLSDLHENAADLVARVRLNGECIPITRYKKVVAMLVPAPVTPGDTGKAA